MSKGSDPQMPLPAGFKAGPHASPGSWESPENKIRITRRKVNEARIEIEGVLDLRLKADTVQRDWWTEDNCFVHLDMEFRQLVVSPSVHGVLGQTYRPQRIKAAKLRALRNSDVRSLYCRLCQLCRCSIHPSVHPCSRCFLSNSHYDPAFVFRKVYGENWA